MRNAVLNGVRAVLLGGPTVLAFFTGGYFDPPRTWAGLLAWLLVLLAALTVARPLLPGLPGRLAVFGLAALAGWTLASASWAPITGIAYHAGQIAMLYVGVLLAGALALRGKSVQRVVEPALAAGALIVIGYGLSARLLPGLLHFQRSVSAYGRLEQPLTYWNAMGELAALGLVLCARLAGDSTRPRGLRAAAAAAAAPLGMGLYITFSRGALFACIAGLIALLVLVPRRAQLAGLLTAFGAAVLAAGAAAPFHSFTSLTGSLSRREGEGALLLALLALIMLAAAGLTAWRAGTEDDRSLRMPRGAPWIALGLITAGLALAIVVGAKEGSGHPPASGATRLTTLQSNRYAYWRVALRAFGNEPLRGVGAGGWSVYWLRYRPFTESAQDAHSLPLQTMAELGLVGVVLLGTFLAGVGLAARDGMRSAPELAAGPIAGFVVWVAHQPLDWDWQMPALTLVAMVLAGQLVALTAPQRSVAPRG